eukprot:TRINITY_DN11114_c0_g1_i1.p1 TRINITY_DN11114_c0_g1~~TRINITY_DN11114_c0_g1_i1.p1  ORF type:complete len:651 (+),score=162.59 TRINITY_DN11114_c0_g1_i1:39-1991(+)
MTDNIMDSATTASGAQSNADTGNARLNYFYKSNRDAEISKRLKALNAQQEGQICITLSWDNKNDLDLHVFTPDDHHLSYSQKSSPCGGKLDVDANASGNTDTPVENIFWIGNPPTGHYRVEVINYAYHCDNHVNDFKLQIRIHGYTRVYYGCMPEEKTQDASKYVVCEFDYMGPENFTLSDEKDGLTYKVYPTIEELIVKSWQENPLDTLKIIFHTRDCRGGKGEKQLFVKDLLWLVENAPEAVLANLALFPEFGKWSDLLYLVGTSLENNALEFYAEQLLTDMKKLKNKEGDISLAAKWAPTEGHKLDKQRNTARKLAKIMFGDSKRPSQDYRKLCLVPLRKYLNITETFMCSKQWQKINYEKIPSVCMTKNRNVFGKNDHERFSQYIKDVKSGKATIKATVLMPHELVAAYDSSDTIDDVIELQWKELVKKSQEAGSLKSTLVVCDLSGSMQSLHKQAALALGLMVSELSEGNFKGRVITFNEEPRQVDLVQETLFERYNHLKNHTFSTGVNIQAVFEHILNTGLQNGLPNDDMPDRVIILSGMQFDDNAGDFSNNHDALKQKFADANYILPEIIYWNLVANTTDYPVEMNENDVALVSGFNPSLLKVFMEDSDFQQFMQTDPMQILKKIVLENDRYKDITCPPQYFY